MSKLDDMRNYLLPLNTSAEDKRYTMYFCKKLSYLNQLMNVITKEINDYVSMGYGNVNAKICIVIKDEAMFSIIKPLIRDVLEQFGINFWNIYVTFIDKTETPYKEKYGLLVNEINAIGPSLLYVIDKDKTSFDDISNYFNSYNISMPQKSFFVDVQKLGSTDENIRRELWAVFRYLINYKEIEQ